MDCKIPLRRAKSPQRIPRQVPLADGRAREIDSRNTARRSSRGRHECRGVECFPAWVLGSIKIERLTGDDVWPDIGNESVRQSTKYKVKNVNRRSGSSLDNILSGPTSKDCVRECVAFRGRHLIGQPYRKRISSIEVGGPSI